MPRPEKAGGRASDDCHAHYAGLGKLAGVHESVSYTHLKLMGMLDTFPEAFETYWPGLGGIDLLVGLSLIHIFLYHGGERRNFPRGLD